MGEIIMPKVGDAMTEGKVVRWYKKSGDAVKIGEPVLEIETDKVNLDLEAEEEGVLDDVTGEEGKMVPVGERLAFVRGKDDKPSEKTTPSTEVKIASEGESSGQDSAERQPAPDSSPKAAAKKSSAEQADARAVVPASGGSAPPSEVRPADKQNAPATGAEYIRSSPLARRMAREMGVDLASVRGSGPTGRIVAADIQGASKSVPRTAAASSEQKARPALVRPAAIESKEIPLTAMRRTIAKRLSESTGPIPHFYLTVEADVTALLQIRQQLNEIAQVKTSVNDYVVRACALSLLHHPVVNSSFTPDAIQQHGDVHVGIAVATPDGLLTPVVRNTNQKSVPEIATEIRSLAEKAKNRKLKPDEYQGSTFMISNLGMYGIEEFTAIINPPNAAILAVGAASPKPVVVEREVVVRDRMRMTLSCDHRVIDGAAGAEFLRTLLQYLEQPLRLVV